ncbi:MAG: histidine phosphatase family protein, partial [Acidobacteriota bacterium]
MPTSLELYLVRHAVAAGRGAAYPDDDLRPLTTEGVERWQRSVAGLRELGVVLDVVIASPLLRAAETADILAAGLRPRPRVVTADALSPGGQIAEVIAVVAAQAGSARGVSR